MYGSRHAWSLFIERYLARVRQLVKKQKSWNDKGRNMLCADQDIITEVMMREPDLQQELLPPDSWDWHTVTQFAPEEVHSV